MKKVSNAKIKIVIIRSDMILEWKAMLTLVK